MPQNTTSMFAGRGKDYDTLLLVVLSFVVSVFTCVCWLYVCRLILLRLKWVGRAIAKRKRRYNTIKYTDDEESISLVEIDEDNDPHNEHIQAAHIIGNAYAAIVGTLTHNDNRRCTVGNGFLTREDERAANDIIRECNLFSASTNAIERAATAGTVQYNLCRLFDKTYIVESSWKFVLDNVDEVRKFTNSNFTIE